MAKDQETKLIIKVLKVLSQKPQNYNSDTSWTENGFILCVSAFQVYYSNKKSCYVLFAGLVSMFISEIILKI